MRASSASLGMSILAPRFLPRAQTSASSFARDLVSPKQFYRGREGEGRGWGVGWASPKTWRKGPFLCARAAETAAGGRYHYSKDPAALEAALAEADSDADPAP